jgi:hypothetical protein
VPRKSSIKMKNIYFQDQELWEHGRLLAATYNTSISQIIERAVRRFVDSHSDIADPATAAAESEQLQLIKQITDLTELLRDSILSKETI